MKGGLTDEGASEGKAGVMGNLPPSTLHVGGVHSEDMLGGEGERQVEEER